MSGGQENNKGWCPQQYRSSIVQWLEGVDLRVQAAFDAYLATTTHYRNLPSTKGKVQDAVDDNEIREQYNQVKRRLSVPFNGVPISPFRLATAFPDRPFAFNSLFCESDTVTLELFNRAARFTMPAVLAYVHALQLDLDGEMQGYADQYNRHHHLAISQNESEVPRCGHFLVKYWSLARVNRIALYFPPGMFTPAAKSESTRRFEPPYSFEQLVAYRRLMAAFSSGGRKANTFELARAFKHIDRSDLTPLDSVVSSFEDERRDGLVPRFESTSFEYREAKAAGLKKKGDRY